MSNYDQNTAASGAARTDVTTIDAGLRAYMLNIYNHMAAGVGLTAVIAWLTYQSMGPELLQSPLMWVFILAPLALVFFISARIAADPAARCAPATSRSALLANPARPFRCFTVTFTVTPRSWPATR